MSEDRLPAPGDGGGGSPRLDPHFDAAFQRGYDAASDPGEHTTQGRRADARRDDAGRADALRSDDLRRASGRPDAAQTISYADAVALPPSAAPRAGSRSESFVPDADAAAAPQPGPQPARGLPSLHGPFWRNPFVVAIAIVAVALPVAGGSMLWWSLTTPYSADGDRTLQYLRQLSFYISIPLMTSAPVGLLLLLLLGALRWRGPRVDTDYDDEIDGGVD